MTTDSTCSSPGAGRPAFAVAGFSPALQAAAAAAAPVLARLRAAQPEPVKPVPTATVDDVAWAYLRHPTRPHGLLKRLCLDNGVDYDAARGRIQYLREKHRVL